jgi:hypothetical protein
MTRLGALWHGRLSLGEAFWIYAVLIGAAVNFTATAVFLAALAADLNGVLAVAIHLLPLPYNAAIVVGVWRSAACHTGSRVQAEAARAAVVAWAVLLTLI